MSELSFQLSYEWRPFLIGQTHLSFNSFEQSGLRLAHETASAWGPAIYMRKGNLRVGEKAGKTGILVGETDDIRARLNQYKTGTQTSGNKYWREEFLRKGDIFYWVFELQRCQLQGVRVHREQLSSKNFRLVLEQLLVRELLASYDPSTTWIVNRMQ